MTSKTSYLIGLIGSGIAGSLTPAMHEQEGRVLGLNYVYRRIDLQALKLEPSALPDLLIAAERMGYDGLNITYPCKQSVIPLLDELDPDARALGAVNTVVLKDGKRIGYNTDWSGFARAFQRGLPDAPLGASCNWARAARARRSRMRRWSWARTRSRCSIRTRRAHRRSRRNWRRAFRIAK